MLNTKAQPITIEKEYRFITQIFIYTVLFVVTAIGVYLSFLVCDRSLLINAEGNIDGIAQEYPTYGYIKRLIESVVAGEGLSAWSWEIGLGAAPLDYFKSKFFNPLTYIITAFPEEYLDIGYNIGTVIRQYLTGITFMFFARGVGLNQNQRIVGAFCYAFSGWAIMAVTLHGSFNTAMIVLPLLILGAEKVLKKESPILFIISVLLFFTTGVLWAYVGGIAVIVFYIVRYCCCKTDISESFIKSFGRFIGYGVVGIMISTCLIISMLISMTSATTDTQVENYGLIYTLKDYLTILSGFFELKSIHTSFGYVYLPIMCIVLIPLIVLNIRKKSTSAIISVSLFIFGLFPIAGEVFNGFSYSVGRWYFIYVFFAVWAAMECMTRETFKSKKNIKAMIIFLIAIAVWNIVICYFALDILSDTAMLSTLVGLVFGLIILGIYYIREFKWQEGSWKEISSYRILNAAIMIILIGSVIGAANMIFYPGLSDTMFKYEERGETHEKFSKSTQKIAVALQEQDDEFFRTDQVDGYNDTRVVRMFTNENIYWGNRSIYSYFSTISSKWHEFNKLMGNNCGYYDRTISFSNDNRAALDTLMGVKYFLGDSETKRPGASEYKPYGFEYYDTIDGVEVFRNKYSLGLGTFYDQYITETELQEFDPLVREQILMQTAVIPDECASSVNSIKHADLSKLQTDIRTVQYDIYGEENLEINDEGEMTVYSEGGSFKIDMKEVKDSQIIISFENLVREKCDYETKLRLSGTSLEELDHNSIKKYINKVSYMDNQRFKIYVTKDNVEKASINNKGKNQGFNDIVDFNVNLGYYDDSSGEIDVYIDNFGKYTFDDIKIYAIPMDIYDDNAAKLKDNRYQIDEFDDTYVDGTVDMADDGLLYLSIIDTPGWHVYVDGEETEKIKNTNIAFTGVEISSGHHRVELKYKYPGMNIAYLITVMGVLIMLGIILYKNRSIKSGNVKDNY